MSTVSNKVLVLFGPTACGKTELLSRLFAPDARALPRPGVVVSADSIQVYRGLDLGSAKPDGRLLSLLPHELLDIRDPRESFSVADFVELADESCARACSAGALPVVSGGTAYYIKAFLMGVPPAPRSDPAVRAAIQRDMDERGLDALRAELEAVDPESAARIAPADAYRIARALEVYRGSGRPLSSFAPSAEPRGRWDTLVIGMDRPRDILYARIDARVDAMVAAGLRDEVRRLVAAGYGPGDPGMRGIGYAEFLAAVESGDAAAIVADIKKHTRQYAKRQLTFMRALPGVRWFDMEDPPSFDAIRSAVTAWLG